MVERPGEAARDHAHLCGDQEHTERAEQQDEGAGDAPAAGERASHRQHSPTYDGASGDTTAHQCRAPTSAAGWRTRRGCTGRAGPRTGWSSR
nr:hypothetical protein [Streptomyces sp. GbtcB7]